jgi:hypothetical protein
MPAAKSENLAVKVAFEVFQTDGKVGFQLQDFSLIFSSNIIVLFLFILGATPCSMSCLWCGIYPKYR